MIKERNGAAAAQKYEWVMGVLPRGAAEEIREISRSVEDLPHRISEIRLRADGLSSISVGGVGYPLFYRVLSSEVVEVLLSLTDGEVYAHRDTMARGYVSVRGCRIGISGFARYDGGSVGVGEICSLVFRLGGSACEFGDSLAERWRAMGEPNLILASPPMGGKTTALRALAGRIGSGREAKRTVVVDERCEFDPAEYRRSSVDVLRGYRRAEGIEQAYRTMAAQVIIIDEIATEAEAEALLGAYGAGVGLIASVHAADHDSIRERACLAPLLDAGAFGAAAVIRREGRAWVYDMREMER